MIKTCFSTILVVLKHIYIYTHQPLNWNLYRFTVHSEMAAFNFQTRSIELALISSPVPLAPHVLLLNFKLNPFYNVLTQLLELVSSVNC